MPTTIARFPPGSYDLAHLPSRFGAANASAKPDQRWYTTRRPSHRRAGLVPSTMEQCVLHRTRLRLEEGGRRLRCCDRFPRCRAGERSVNHADEPSGRAQNCGGPLRGAKPVPWATRCLGRPWLRSPRLPRSAHSRIHPKTTRKPPRVAARYERHEPAPAARGCFATDIGTLNSITLASMAMLLSPGFQPPRGGRVHFGVRVALGSQAALAAIPGGKLPSPRATQASGPVV